MKISRIALVFPETRYPAGQPPLGVGYLASSLLAAHPDLEVTILDRSYHSDPETALEQDVAKGKFDMLGISLVTPHLGMARRLAAIAKQARPQTIVVVGGPHATMLPQETLEIENVDMVCMGEGEKTLPQLVAQDGEAEGIAGMAYWREDGSVVVEDRTPPLADLDVLPYPARHLYDMENYVKHWYSMDTYRSGMRGTSVFATRGCPYRCTFCQPTISTMFGNKIHKRSPQSMVDEIIHIRDRFSLAAFMFEDSTFTLDHKWVRAVAQELIERKADMVWCCNVRVDSATYDLLRDMKEAGLRKVNMGVESGSNRILSEVYDKGITVEQVRSCLADCKRLGLKVQGYFMLGAPTETRAEMRATLDLAASEPFDDAVFDITTPFPGTRLYDMSYQDIVAPYEEFDCFQRTVYSHAGELTPEAVASLKKKAYWKFYLHPRRILRTMGMVLAPKGFSRLLLKAKRV